MDYKFHGRSRTATDAKSGFLLEIKRCRAMEVSYGTVTPYVDHLYFRVLPHLYDYIMLLLSSTIVSNTLTCKLRPKHTRMITISYNI